MKNIGFIGTGSMGSLLIESYIKGGVNPQTVHFMNRSKKKAGILKEKYPSTTSHQHLETLAKETDWIFLCTKPLDMIPVLKQLDQYLQPRHTIITITSPLQAEEAESLLSRTSTPVCRCIPSIVNLSLAGPSLITFGARCTKSLKEELWSFFSIISEPVLTEPSVTRVASDLASCGPAFISFLFQEMIRGAIEERGIDINTATDITESMLAAYGKILKEKQFDLAGLQKRVTVPGGVTGVGLNVLNEEVNTMFHKLFRQTEMKYQKDRKEIKEMLE